MLGRLARTVARWRWWIVAACLAATAAAAPAGHRLFRRLGYAVFYDPAAESTRARALAHDRFGQGDPDVVALYQLPAGVTVDDPRLRAALGDTLERVARDPAVKSALSTLTVSGDRFVSRDRRSTFVVLALDGDPGIKAAAVPRLQPLLQLELPAGPGRDAQWVRPLLGGLVPSGRSLTRLARQSLALGERISLPVVALLLVLIFGSVVAALLPLIIGGLSIVLTLGVLDLLSPLIPVDAFAINVVTILGLGVAIDYALFVVSRYREELARADDGTAVCDESDRELELSDDARRLRALIRAVETAGRSVLFSGITVAASLAGLLVFPQPFLRSVAIGGMAVVLLGDTLALVVLPALLYILDVRLERGRLLRSAHHGPAARDPERFWRALAVSIIRRRLAVSLLVTALLLALAWPFVRLRPSRSDVRALPAAEEPRRVTEALARDFSSATLTPVSLVVSMAGAIIDEDRLGALYDYVERIGQLRGVERVESIFYFAGGTIVTPPGRWRRRWRATPRDRSRPDGRGSARSSAARTRSST